GSRSGWARAGAGEGQGHQERQAVGRPAIHPARRAAIRAAYEAGGVGLRAPHSSVLVSRPFAAASIDRGEIRGALAARPTPAGTRGGLRSRPWEKEVTTRDIFSRLPERDRARIRGALAARAIARQDRTSAAGGRIEARKSSLVVSR